MREKGQTKDRILMESMKMFSVKGFEAVSVREIADAVGIGNSALYKHFKSKQEIFDTIVEMAKQHYLDKCTSAVTQQIRGVEQVKQVCLDMFNYQTTNDLIVMFRKILIIEQFKNPKMAELYKEFFIDIPLNHQQKIFEKLISMKLMRNRNPRVMALELYSPFFMYHTIKEDEEQLHMLFELHAQYFFENNIILEVK